MTTAGSSALWSLADEFGVVPSPPNPTLTKLLRAWWALPRRFGCEHGRRSPTWVVVAPDFTIRCPLCAAQAFASTSACAFCRRPTTDDDPVVIWQEMKGNVTVVGHAHHRCAEPAEGGDAEDDR